MSPYHLTAGFREEDCGHPEMYFSERLTWLDTRGVLKISPLSWWGWENKVITQTHSIATGEFFGPAINAPVIVDDYAWITSFCILSNCHIQHHAIISAGTVMVGYDASPYTIVAGNPPLLVAEWNPIKKKWEKFMGRDWKLSRHNR